MQPNLKWNFDLEDCAKILRIDSPTDLLEIVTKLLQERGFDGKELTD